MKIIPVIDLLGGQVVRGIGGRRDEYRPIVSQIAADARPATVARALVERFGFNTVYVADLDAITSGRHNVRAWQEISAAGLSLWLDAGIGSHAALVAVGRELAVANIDVELILGLESIAGIGELLAIRQLQDTIRPSIFSLDLRDGRPVLRESSALRLSPPLMLARMAQNLGMSQIIVLDLADVGSAGGTTTLGLCREIRDCLPDLTIIAGGGVRGLDDLKALADAGCDAALVASALHDGRLTQDDIASLAR